MKQSNVLPHSHQVSDLLGLLNSGNSVKIRLHSGKTLIYFVPKTLFHDWLSNIIQFSSQASNLITQWGIFFGRGEWLLIDFSASEVSSIFFRNYQQNFEMMAANKLYFKETQCFDRSGTKHRVVECGLLKSTIVVEQNFTSPFFLYEMIWSKLGKNLRSLPSDTVFFRVILITGWREHQFSKWKETLSCGLSSRIRIRNGVNHDT